MFGYLSFSIAPFRNTNKYLKSYTPGSKPLFYEDDVFRTEIPLVSVVLSTYTDQLIHWMDLPVTVKEHLGNGLSQITLDPSMAGALWDDIILFLVPGWNQKGTRLRELDWPKKQHVTIGEIQKVPGWNQKGTKLMHKKVRYLIAILMLASIPVKLEKMMDWIGYKNRKTFRNNYLNPLQKVGWVQMTNPENPSDPDQKYITTESGKLFLAGRIITQSDRLG